MTATQTYKIVKFDGLTDAQKEKVINNNRGWNVEDLEWWDCIYDDAKNVGGLMGIDIDRIFFSGFCSQGDGACIEGTFSHVKNIVKNIKAYAPLDTDLHNIAETFSDIYRKSFYTLNGRIKQSGHYTHERSMSFCYDYDKGSVMDNEIEDAFADFAKWIYKNLEREYDYLTSDDCIIETIRCNETEFHIDEDGTIIHHW